MAQHDYVIANGTGAAVRSDLNSALSAIVSQNSGATEPATMYAYQWWADTTTGLLKIRNAANNAWVTVGTLASANLGLLSSGSTITAALGSASTPGITFTGDLNTGIYSPGADQVAISTNGTGRLFVNSTGLVGVGTNSPSETLTISKSQSSNAFPLHIENSVNFGWGVGLKLRQALASGGSIIDSAAIVSDWQSDNNSTLEFYTTTNSSLTEKLRITSEGRVGVGTTSPGRLLQVSNTSGDPFISILGAASNNGGLLFGDNASDASGQVRYDHSVDAMYFATNATERCRLDSSGRLLVGTSSASAVTDGNISAQLEVEGTTTATSAISIIRNSNDTNAGGLIIAKSRGTTAGSNTSVSSGDELGFIQFQGADGTQKRIGAYIGAFADAATGSNDLPTRLVFSTTADGASSPTERVRINEKGALKATTTGSYNSSTNKTHELRSDNNDWSVYIQNTNAAPKGLLISHNGAAPNGTGNEFLYCDDTTALRASIRSNGGFANFQANNVNLSDRNAKKDISPATDTWDCIKEWEIVNYRYKDQPDDADLNLGVIAQQVAESCPEVITVFQQAKEATEDQPAQEERLGVKEQQMYWMAIKALQEAQVRIEQLEAKVAALEGA